MISNDPKFNLSQLNAYKRMFAIKLSMEKRIKIILSGWFSDLPAANATSFIQKALSILEMHLRFDNVNSKIKWPQSKVGGAQLALAVDIFHKWGTI